MVTPLEARFESGASAGLQIRHNHERIREPFPIRRPIVIAAGSYNFLEWDVSATTPEYR